MLLAFCTNGATFTVARGWKNQRERDTHEPLRSKKYKKIKRKEHMKKTTVRAIAIGSIALTAATAGAWFMLTSAPHQKKVDLASPSSSGEMRQQTSIDFDLDNSPATQATNPANEKQEVVSDPTDYPSENLQESATKEKQEQGSEAEDAEDTRITAEEEQTKELSPLTHTEPPPTSTAAPALPDLQTSENLQKGVTQDNMTNTTAIPSSPPGEEKQPLDIASPTQTKEEEDISGPSCKEVSPVLTNFVNSLEKKEYSKEESSAQPLQEHFNALATQLVNNPPVVIHETDELYTVLTNTAHFFRILGKDNMRLLRKVLKQETGDFEDIAAEIYRLSTGGEQCVSGNKRLKIPFTAAYEYAGFFLNTLGGRSYLFRRDSGTRLLVNYYAVLALDQANKKQLNNYGLDIREQLPWLIQEMEANNRLTHREQYLDKLYELAEEYQALP
ncbi:MAG: hypothetical protein D3925_06445 [Candidatus Electrothrix sp. AR5]|nr:hypothetical protein [Candidatus Electrothrix sp. AR5]